MTVKKKKIPAAFPSSCSLGWMEHEATRDGAELPRSYFYFGKFVSWKKVAERTTKNMILHQQDQFSFKTPLKGLQLPSEYSLNPLIMQMKNTCFSIM